MFLLEKERKKEKLLPVADFWRQVGEVTSNEDAVTHARPHACPLCTLPTTVFFQVQKEHGKASETLIHMSLRKQQEVVTASLEEDPTSQINSFKKRWTQLFCVNLTSAGRNQFCWQKLTSAGWTQLFGKIWLHPEQLSVWTLADCEWHAAALGLNPLRLPRAPHPTPTHVNRQPEKEGAWGRPRLLHTVLKCYFFRSFVTCHKRATAWLFHVRARQNYCVSHLSSRRSDGGLTIHISCLKDKANMRTGSKREGHTWGRRSAPQYYTYLCTVNLKHTLSRTRPCKIAAKGVGVLHLGVAGHRAWSRTWEGPSTFVIIYTK